MSRIIKGSLGLAATIALGSTAQAGTTKPATCVVQPTPCVSCAGPKTGKSTLPPLSSYFDHQAQCGTVYKPAPTIVHHKRKYHAQNHHAPKHHAPKHHAPKHHTKKPCVVVVTQTTTKCRVVIKKAYQPVVRPPKVHPPIVRPPVVHPPVIYRPQPSYVRVIRPIVPVPYPVPVPVTYPVYAPCPTTAPCQPVRRRSRYGG